MKEIREIITEYDRLHKINQPMALATVFDVKGSSYRRTGARMLIKEDGKWLGGISGGCIEGNALKHARLVMADQQARIVTYDTSKDDKSNIGVSLGCNGIISVIITALNPTSKLNPIKKLKEVVDSRQPVVLITVLESNDKSIPTGAVLSLLDIEDLTSHNESMHASIAVGQDVLQAKKSRLVELGSFKLFFEYLVPNLHLVVMGGNYDVFPLLQLAGNLGWKRTIVTNPHRLYPPAHKAVEHICENIDEVEIDDQTVAVMMSHDYRQDLDNLALALQTDLAYIGLLGPAVRKNDMLEELRDKGLSVDQSRIYGPAGLDIGAIQPDEIASAITSEIISVIRNRPAGSLRERQQPIHDREIDSTAATM